MAGEKEGKEEVLYVGVRDPVEIRRTVLEGTKDVVEVLQRLERFKAVREEKIKTVNLLKDQIKEVTKLINKARLDLPKVDVRVRLHEEERKIEAEKADLKESKSKKSKKKSAKKAAKGSLKTKELSDLEKLEAELTSIEQKLGRS